MTPVEIIRDLVKDMVTPFKHRIYNMISRAVVESTNDAEGLQLLKLAILAKENRSGVERFQDYGFSSNPKNGAEALVVCPQGNREHVIAVKVDDRRFRLKSLAEGEVALYTDEGDKIHFKRGGLIEVLAASKVNIQSPLVQMSGNLIVDGNLSVGGDSDISGNETVGGNSTVSGDVSAANVSAASQVSGSVVGTPGTDLDTLKDTYNTHTHQENGDGGGTTDPPDQTI